MIILSSNIIDMSQQSLLRAKLGREHNTLQRFVCDASDMMTFHVELFYSK